MVGVHGVGGLVGTLLAAVAAVAALGTENGAENYNMLAQLDTDQRVNIYDSVYCNCYHNNSCDHKEYCWS